MNGGEINEQVRQDEVSTRQKQFRDGEEIEMTDTDVDKCNETNKLPNHINDLLTL